MLRACIIGLCCLWSLTAQAIVNIEEMRSRDEQDGLTSRASVLVNGASGNTDKTAIAFSGRLQWRQGPVSQLLIARYDYGESNNTRNTNKTFVHGRYTRRYQPQRAAEFFVQAEQNEFARLDFRGLIGTGLRLTLRDGGTTALAFGIGLFHSWETLDQRVGLTDDGTETLWRANTYLALNHHFNDRLRLANTVYFQPSFDDIDDYRLLDEGSLNIELTERLDFKLLIDISHDNQPPQTVEKTDISYETGLEYRF